MASRSPLESLNKIETNIKAADAALAKAGSMLSPTAGDTPLEVFLTVMGLKSKDLVSKLELGDERFLEALKGRRGHGGDDSFDELTEQLVHLYKLAQTTPPESADAATKSGHRMKFSARFSTCVTLSRPPFGKRFTTRSAKWKTHALVPLVPRAQRLSTRRVVSV